MTFISTKNMTNDNAPKGQVLVQYLEPFFGYWTIEFAIAYFDNPNDYKNGDGQGWLLWNNDAPINVLCYMELPETVSTILTTITQQEFIIKFGSFHPNLGNAASL